MDDLLWMNEMIRTKSGVSALAWFSFRLKVLEAKKIVNLISTFRKRVIWNGRMPVSGHPAKGWTIIHKGLCVYRRLVSSSMSVAYTFRWILSIYFAMSFRWLAFLRTVLHISTAYKNVYFYTSVCGSEGLARRLWYI
jgi:hypothetical protein